MGGCEEVGGGERLLDRGRLVGRPVTESDSENTCALVVVVVVVVVVNGWV